MMATSQAGGASSSRPAKRRLIGRFRRSQDGATAVEFGFIAFPFFALIFAILEIGLMFWTSEILEESLTQASRRLLTGQAVSRYASTDPAKNATAFRNDICALAPIDLIDCSKLQIDVKVYSNFGDAKTGSASPVSGGALNTRNFSYDQPKPGQIVVARAVLDYRLFLTSWASAALANLGPGHRALVATAVFRAEPFAGNAGAGT